MNSGAANWPKYNTFFDCSSGVCTVYCPQWCYTISSPPPPPKYYHRPLSPLLISLIAILATAVFILTYFSLVVIRFCRPRPISHNPPPPLSHHLNSPPLLLDDAAISCLGVCRYTRCSSSGGVDGVDVQATDCAVCLGEFEEGESLRLLPVCNHAFHLPCIDAWLKSHSTCPLCRSSIIPLPRPPRVAHLHICRRGDAGLTVHDRTHEVVVEVSGKAEAAVVDMAAVCRSDGASASMESSSLHPAGGDGCDICI